MGCDPSLVDHHHFWEEKDKGRSGEEDKDRMRQVKTHTYGQSRFYFMKHWVCGPGRGCNLYF